MCLFLSSETTTLRSDGGKTPQGSPVPGPTLAQDALLRPGGWGDGPAVGRNGNSCHNENSDERKKTTPLAEGTFFFNAKKKRLTLR